MQGITRLDVFHLHHAFISPLRRHALSTPLCVLRDIAQYLRRIVSRYVTWLTVPYWLKGSLIRRYRNVEEEQLYWQAAARARKALEASNANHPPENLPLLVYYAPKLLPRYRDLESDDPEAREEYIAPETFCKWHRMVYPGPVRIALRIFEMQS